jgi:hypothetical protein
MDSPPSPWLLTSLALTSLTAGALYGLRVLRALWRAVRLA